MIPCPYPCRARPEHRHPGRQDLGWKPASTTHSAAATALLDSLRAGTAAGARRVAPLLSGLRAEAGHRSRAAIPPRTPRTYSAASRVVVPYRAAHRRPSVDLDADIRGGRHADHHTGPARLRRLATFRLCNRRRRQRDTSLSGQRQAVRVVLIVAIVGSIIGIVAGLVSMLRAIGADRVCPSRDS
jgi:hypothetical protein